MRTKRFLRAAFAAAQFGALLLGVFLLLGYFWVGGTFEHATIDMMFLYLSLPLTGVDKQYIINFSLYVVLATLVLALVFLRLRRAVAAGRIPGLRPRLFNALALALSLGVPAYAVRLWETKYGVYDYVFPDTAYYTYFEERAAVVDAADVSFDDDRRNLILIIVEALDSAMAGDSVFTPPLMPALRKIHAENQTFSGHRPTYGSAGSISSFTSMTTGVPLKFEVRAWNNPLKEDETEYFSVADLPETHAMQRQSMPGILEKNGCRVQLMRSAREEFSGLNLLLRLECENIEIFDYSYFEKNRTDFGGRTNNWGVNDSYLYERSREVLTRTAAGGKPFAHIIQTVNTHLPGYFEDGMPREHGDIRDAFQQADSMLGEYVEWVLAQPFAEKTTIVIAGDHLIALGGIGGIALPPTEERGIELVFINSVRPAAPRGYARLFATWDVAPSILDAVGCRLPDERLGLGTSLFSDKETLLEKEGVAEYERMIVKRSKLYNDMYRWLQ